MELQIKPHTKNSYPLGGVLIKGAAATHWIKEIQQMGLSLHALTVYPIPGTGANTVWGCLVASGTDMAKTTIGRNQFCQLVSTILFIPEKSILYPALSAAETDQLFKRKKHVLHPEFGLVELEEPVDWKELIATPVEVVHAVYEPAPAPFIPTAIKTFQIKPVATEEALQMLEEGFPRREKFKDKPLNLFERIKLYLYKGLFNQKKAGLSTAQKPATPSPLLSKLEGIKKLFSQKENNWVNKLQIDYEELERRNQKHLDRLLELLRENPEEALKYAIPLDTDGTDRGSNPALFDLQKRWFDFSLFNTSGPGRSGGTTVLPDDAFRQLQAQYRQTAQELIKQKEYKKAAFVYMKLLKDYYQAAQTLEEGGFYHEAGTIYLKYSKNKLKAAECFEKGNLVSQAIELYEELHQYEKAGDLYSLLHHTAEAQRCYQKVADDYVGKDLYIKASLLYKNKMNNPEASRQLLLQGWRSNKDAFNCLTSYFAGIPDLRQLADELQTIYGKDVNSVNRQGFLQVLKGQFDQHQELSAPIKEMAYEIIAAQVPVNPSIVSELQFFNKNDKQLMKDTMRFKLNLKKLW